MAKKKKKLKIVLGTNIIHTNLADKLMRKDLKEIMIQSKKNEFYKVEWHIPKMVIDERRFQMNKLCRKYLPSLKKVEIILGHNLNITDEVLTNRIDTIIENEIKQVGAKVPVVPPQTKTNNKSL